MKRKTEYLDTLEERLRTLRKNETVGAVAHHENLIDFEDSHVVFGGHDLNLSRVYPSDYIDQNELGIHMDALIRCQTEKIPWSFFKYPDSYQGYLLTDRDKDVFPVGHIYYMLSSIMEGPNYKLEPIFLTVHPEYFKKGFSKLLRFILMYDQLIREPGNEKCGDIFVIPYFRAREKVYGFFKKLDPALIPSSTVEPMSAYNLNPETVRLNLNIVQKEMGIEIRRN